MSENLSPERRRLRSHISRLDEQARAARDERLNPGVDVARSLEAEKEARAQLEIARLELAQLDKQEKQARRLRDKKGQETARLAAELNAARARERTLDEKLQAARAEVATLEHNRQRNRRTIERLEAELRKDEGSKA